ncbi:DNA-binding transcription factor yap1 [Lobulomyces angularis]|nr:DNA-binding transcription factor yap1 [Lobulomyces angularis]
MQFLDFLTQPIPGFPTMLNVNSKREADTNNISSRKSKSNTTSHSEDDNEEESNKKGQTEKKKPGRKPTQIDPSNKRTAQNRAAQRAFRERKEKYLSDLETKVRELEEANKLSKGESTLKLIQENKQLKETIENLRTENSMLKVSLFELKINSD